MVGKHTHEYVETIDGVLSADLEAGAYLFGKARSACIFYGMGIMRHTNGTDNVKSVLKLLPLTGNIGRKGVGLRFIRVRIMSRVSVM